MQHDPRLRAFLSRNKEEIFHSIEHRHEVWKADPFDVETIHEKPRAIFDRLLTRATTPPGVDSGRILLLLGESGCGKTHLVRAFRNKAHADRTGYVGYMQMTSATTNYGRYVLSNLIDSLDKPYYEEDGSDSGLMRLSKALAGRCPDRKLIKAIRDEQLGTKELTAHVHTAADLLVALPRHAEMDLDLDLVRALLYLQRNDQPIKGRVLKYLRCEPISDADRDMLGGIVPRYREEDPQIVVEMLGKLIYGLANASLVICVDQLEDMVNFADAEGSFRRAMTTVCAIADRVPSSIFVICCLEDYYKEMKGRLSRSMLDRIERDPDPIVLTTNRSADEVLLLVERRLAYLYDAISGAPDEADPTYPFLKGRLEALANSRTRDVLDQCRRFRELAMDRQALPEAFPLPELQADATSNVAAPAPIIALEQAWNDFLADYKKPRPDEEADFARLFAQAIRGCADELETGHRIEARQEQEYIDADVIAPWGDVERLLISVCNRNARGGGLAGQVTALAERAQRNRIPVLLRSTDFPTNPGTQVAQQIGRLVSERRARRVVVEDSDWRTMLALEDFRQKHESSPDFRAWRRAERPLSQLRSLREALLLDTLRAAASSRPPSTQKSPSEAAPTPAPAARKAQARPDHGAAAGQLYVGTSAGLSAQPLNLACADLTQHMAILGGSGSGKTTLALNVVEQLLLNGVPVILIDRKGDLSGYAAETTWTRPLPDPELAARRDRLRSQVDVALFTPGHKHGRPLSISLVPDGLTDLSDVDREQAASYAAQALGGMLNYRQQGTDKSCRAILSQALNLLSAAPPPSGITLDTLIQLLVDQDPGLVNAIGHLDTKLFKKLVQDLETLKLTTSDLLSAGGERLDMDALLGRGEGGIPGKTRLSIVATKFLGDSANILFWVSQLLLEVLRWSSRQPSSKLQAVLLFDEADIYLPAIGQPATKAPMENLLKRGRSAGLGILLATQSPGDFDYRCRDTIRTWFVGRIKEQTAIGKMKPMLSECRVDVASKLPGQTTGQFHMLRDGSATAFRSALATMTTEQLSEDVLLKLAAKGRPL